jgi:hypothetical protein
MVRTLVAVLALSLGVAVAPAGALVASVPTGSGTATIGLQPRETWKLFNGSQFVWEGDRPTAATFSNSAGNSVLRSPNTYAIYWDPTDKYHGDWQHLIDVFLQGVGAESGSLGNIFAVDTQYGDKSSPSASYHSVFHGAYTDTDAYPTSGCTDPAPLAPGEAISCLTDKQVQSELGVFISDHGLQKGMGSVFYLLTPPGVTVCLDKGTVAGRCSDYKAGSQESYEHSFCSYHSDVSPTNPTDGDANTILYAAIPWTAGGLGDYHLRDETSAYECQDGGFDPSSNPIEEQEKPKVDPEEEVAKRLSAEKKENEELTAYEEQFGKEVITKAELEAKRVEFKGRRTKREEVETEEREKREKSEGPRQQEPNQDGLGPDGSYDTGLADLIINQIAVEQQNMVTDPLLDAWKDEAGYEVTDECRNFFASGQVGGSSTANEKTGAGTLSNQTFGGNPYYLNTAFNLAALRLGYPAVPCLGGVNLNPEFTVPNPVNSGETVGFDGMESDITLNSTVSVPSGKIVYATYKWNFGDGTPEVTGQAPGAPSVNSPGTSPCAAPWEAPCAASTFHSYQYGGTYNVTLTATDVGGNTGSVTKAVTVVGPAPPAPPAPPSPPSGGGSSPATTAGGSGASSSTPGAATKPPSGPVASQAAATHSLSTALSKGLVVNYSVNEQVAGQFQVLLASSVAKRIGLHGTPATGMPPGSAPSIVIGKAILVTTKGGRNSVRIQFGKKTAAKLRKLSKVSLMIRLVVRNSSRGAPSTTVLSTVTLSR